MGFMSLCGFSRFKPIEDRRGHRSTPEGVPNVTLLTPRNGRSQGVATHICDSPSMNIDPMSCWSTMTSPARVVDASRGPPQVPVMAYIRVQRDTRARRRPESVCPWG
jgi:hypothetical protein